MDNRERMIAREYMDAMPLVERVVITCWTPALIQDGKQKISTEEANMSRMVKKNRWIVESKNGYFRSILKFSKETIIMPHLHRVQEFYSIPDLLIFLFLIYNIYELLPLASIS